MDEEAEKRVNRRTTQPSFSSSATSSPRKSTDSSASSPEEFEFWMVRNPSFPQPNILSADQLFVNGVLLPLHLVPQNPPLPVPLKPDIDITKQQHPDPSPPESAAAVGSSSASKRWKDIFKIGDRKASSSSNEVVTTVLEEKEKDKRKKDKKSRFGSSSISSSAADLNINIWPFSRSRSAGNGSSSGGRARASAAAARKVSSAPCSRSNSAGESKSSKKWPSSPGRAGVHLGRSSPVWQVRRGGKAAEPAVARREGAGARRAGGGGDRTNGNGGSTSTARVLNLSVPLCIGYRQHLSCSRDESGFGNPSREDGNGGAAADGHSHGSGNSISNSPLFNLRTLFSKKVH